MYVFRFRLGRPVEPLNQDGELSGEEGWPGFVQPLAEVFGWLMA